MRRRTPSWCAARYCIFSNIDRPGTSRTPPTITRPGSPHACRSTAVIIDDKRMCLSVAGLPRRSLGEGRLPLPVAGYQLPVLSRTLQCGMPRDSSQSAKNHARIVPLYHLVAGPIFFANFFWSAYRAIRQPSGPTIFALLLAIAFIILFFFARVFALTVQDRIIRLEM